MEPVMAKKPLKKLKAIQSIKDYTEQSHRLLSTNSGPKKANITVADKSLLSVLNTLNQKQTAVNVLTTLSNKDEEALKIHNRIQYLQHQEKKKLRHLQEEWKVA